MNNIYARVLVIMAMVLCPVNAFADSKFADAKDEAAIKTIVESVGTLADTGNFEALEKLYAPEVRLDYTSLTGGEVEIKTPREIMTQWAGVLPGFDRTRHDIRRIKTRITGNTATATAEVTADHWVGDMFWQVRGGYMYELRKENGEWRITAHRFSLKSEKGTRDVFGPAAENAARNPVPYLNK